MTAVQLPLFDADAPPAPPTKPSPPSYGQVKVASVVKYLVDNPIKDTVAEGPKLSIGYGQKLCIEDDGSNTSWTLHDNALTQIAQKLRIPISYVFGLAREEAAWSRDLLCSNINTLFTERARESSFLLRAVEGEVRGFFSNAYKRMHTTKLLEAFSQANEHVGAEPHDAHASDIRIIVQSALPTIYQTNEGSAIKAGVALKHSDFVVGTLSVNFMLTCHGLPMISGRGIRKTHRGRRLLSGQEDRNSKIASEDTKLACEDIRKLVFQHLAKENIEAVMAEIALAEGQQISVDSVAKMLEGLELSEDEAKRAERAYINVRNLPYGNNMLRFASTIAWLAEDTQDVDRKIELMQLAGGLVMKE